MPVIHHPVVKIAGVAGAVAQDDARHGVKDDVVERNVGCEQGRVEVVGKRAACLGFLEFCAEVEYLAGVETGGVGQLRHRRERKVHRLGDEFADVAVFFFVVFGQAGHFRGFGEGGRSRALGIGDANAPAEGGACDTDRIGASSAGGARCGFSGIDQGAHIAFDDAAFRSAGQCVAQIGVVFVGKVPGARRYRPVGTIARRDCFRD